MWASRATSDTAPCRDVEATGCLAAARSPTTTPWYLVDTLMLGLR
jgi:hypothetical protein